MDSDSFSAACRALVGARRSGRAIDVFPAEWLPGDLAEAYRLQHAVAGELGRIGGWKVAAVTEAQRAALAVTAPLAAPLMAGWLCDASQAAAELSAATFIDPKLECEFAFELGRDLPPRPNRDYTRDEIAAATATLRIAVEVVDSRLPRGLGALAELADAFNNGAFVAGPALRRWQALDFARTGIVLTAVRGGETSELARGNGSSILGGDPFGTVLMLANAQPGDGPGLLAGQIVTTGSCTGAPRLPGPGLYRADFAGLGSVELRFLA